MRRCQRVCGGGCLLHLWLSVIAATHITFHIFTTLASFTFTECCETLPARVWLSVIAATPRRASGPRWPMGSSRQSSRSRSWWCSCIWDPWASANKTRYASCPPYYVPFALVLRQLPTGELRPGPKQPADLHPHQSRGRISHFNFS